jgi:DNA-binding transcriptional LysR family regulator
MELRQLRSFLGVAQELHFGRAAAKLHMSQPPLSVHIRELEKELDVQLLQRSTRKVTLTAAGEVFRERAAGVLADLDEAVVEAQEVRAGRRGRVRVGFVSSASVTVIPRVVRRFRDLHPHIRLVLEPLTSGEQVEALYVGALDLGLIRGSQDSAGLVLEPVLTEQMVAVLPASHRLAGRPVVTPEELANEQLILFPYRLMPGFAAQVRGILLTEGRSPQVVQEAIHHETILGLVSAEVGVSILPESVSRFHTEGVEIRPISTAPRTALLVARPAHVAAPATQAFLECLRASATGSELTPA